MKWTGKLEPQVSDSIIRKGYGYFRAGVVNIVSGTDSHLHAIVQGSIPYSVTVEVENSDVRVACTCPYFDHDIVCKHIWATFLAAESEGHLTEISTLAHPNIEFAIDFLDEFDDDPTTPNSNDVQPAVLPYPYPAKPQTPPPPEWKQRLRSLRENPMLMPPHHIDDDRSVAYVVRGSDSLAFGALLVQAVVRRRKRNGEWGRPNFQETSIRSIDRLDETDRRMLSLLKGNSQYAGWTNIPSTFTIVPASSDVLVPMLCSTGRFYLRRQNEPMEELQLLEWDDGPPWSFHLAVVPDLDTRQYRVTASLQRGAESVSVRELALTVRNLVIRGNRISRFEGEQTFVWTQAFRDRDAMEVPFEHRLDLLEEISKFPVVPAIDLPDELAIEARTLDIPPAVKIRQRPQRWSSAAARLICELEFNYSGVTVAESKHSFAELDPRSGRYFRRDLDAERKASAQMTKSGAEKAGVWEKHKWELAPSRLPALTRELLSLGWTVEAEGRLYRRSTSVRVEVRSGIDWFELDGSAAFDTQKVGMPEILRAIARGESMVKLGDGSFGLLPEEWLKRYRIASSFGRQEEGHIRFGRHQAGLIDALLATEAEVDFDAEFQRVRDELKSFSGVQPVEATHSFEGALRHYQKEGLGWLHFIRRFGFGGCLADDMGLGKTIQVLALLSSGARRGPVLVVVPRSLVFNWKQESAKFTPRLRVLDQTGMGRKQRWTLVKDHDIVLATYGTIRRDILTLKEIVFDTIILDEAQAIKNPATESAKAVRLLKGEHRLVLTGTPIENRLNDLWSLFEFLNPGMLGSASVFRSYAVAKPNGSPASDNGSLELLAKALQPFILRRTKEQVARELPRKTEQSIYCELDARQRKEYDELRNHYRKSLLGRIEEEGIQKSRIHILDALLRLRQAACHPGLIDKKRTGESSAKLDALLPQLSEVIQEGHKALIFSQFTSLLAIVKQRLNAEGISYEYLDGRTRDREARVRNFQQDENCRLFLISLKAGGLGLNLTQAEYVFLLDPWWNPAVEAQAIDRTHRIGQSRRVFAYRLIARDTVEEKVIALQKTKRELAEAIITADNSLIAGLTRETLELLLS